MMLFGVTLVTSALNASIAQSPRVVIVAAACRFVVDDNCIPTPFLYLPYLPNATR